MLHKIIKTERLAHKRLKMKVRMQSAIVLAALGLLPLSVRAGVTYYLTSGTGTNGSGWTTPSCWTDSAGNPASAIDAENDFVVDGNRTVKVSGDFAGKSLTVGNAHGSSWAYLYCRGNATFANAGSFLACGYASWMAGGDGKAFSFKGKNTITAPASKPFGFIGISSYKNLKFNVSNLASAAGTAAMVGATVHNGSITYSGRGFTVNLRGSTADCYGDLIVTSKFAVAASSIYYGAGLTVENGGTLPGGIRLCGGGGLVLTDTELEVGRLMLEPGSIIRTTMNVSGGTCYSAKVTTSLSVTGPVYVSTDGHTPTQFNKASPTARCKLLTGPVGVRIDSSQFVFLPDPAYEENDGCYPQRMHFEVDTDGETDVDTLYLVVDPVVLMDTADPNSKWLKVEGSCLTNVASWSDGKLPHANAIYRVISRFRSTFDDEVYTFPGEPLYLDGGTEFHLYGNRRFEVRDFRWVASEIWSGEGSRPVLCGGTLRLGDSGTRRFRVFDTTFTLESEIIGSAELTLTDMSHVGSDNVRRWGELTLAALNTNFTGRINVTRDQYAGGLVLPSMSLNVSDARNLGGSLAAFDFRALQLKEYGRLAPLNSMTLPGESNRGIFVNTNGTINVADGLALRIEWPITMNGTLHKIGQGTLELAGALKFYDTMSNAESDETRAEVDVLDIHEGSVKLGSAKACDGFTLLADGGKVILPLAPDEGSDLKRYGLWNVKSATPFACADGVKKFPIEFEPATGAFPGGIVTNALVTVANSALEATLATLKRPTVYESVPTVFALAPVEGANATTILCVTRRRGMMLIIQ